MKNENLKWLYACLLIALLSVLTGCAVPKYSYDKEDAGTVFLSQTTNFSMSDHAHYWAITFEAVDEKIRTEIAINSRKDLTWSLGLAISARVYEFEGKNAVARFPIRDYEKFGDAHQTIKLPPGKYKIASIQVRKELFDRNRLPAPFIVKLYNDTVEQYAKLLTYSNTKDKFFPNIEFTVQPGKAVYLGEFNAIMDECTKRLLLNYCEKFQVTVKDEFVRDSDILKNYLSKRPTEPSFKFVNQAVKIEKSKSPNFFSEP